MVCCHFCKLSSSSQYLFTSCEHFVCLACCYNLTDFNLFQIQCCHLKTKIDPLAMTTIIKQNQIKKRYSEPMSFSPKGKATIREDVLNGQKNAIHQKSYYSHNSEYSPHNRSTISRKKDSLWKQLQEQSFKQPHQKENSQNIYKYDSIKETHYKEKKDNVFKSDSIKENAYTQGKQSCDDKKSQVLQTILLTQIERVKREFDDQHDALRKKQEYLIKQLINIYEEQSRERFTQSNNNLCVSRLNNRIKDCLGSQHRLGLMTLSQKEDHYDHIMKRLDVNKERMEERIKKHRQTLN